MHEPTQADEDGRFFDAAAIQSGLLRWLAILVVGGLGSVLLGHAEAALLFAGAGAFALAQATDAAAAIERYRALVHERLPAGSLQGVLVRTAARALVPVAGMLVFVGFGSLAGSSLSGVRQLATEAWCVMASVVCLSLTFRTVADAITLRLFPGGTGRTRRLSARLVVIALLMPVPAAMVLPSVLANLDATGTPLADPQGLIAQLGGELALALAGVGLFVRRDWTAARLRLGLTLPTLRHLALAAAGFGAAFALNAGTEWIERHWFHALWLHDTEMTKRIAASLPVWGALVLGTSAGVGEELVVRGALQPRLGIPLSALVFSLGHVQYSWYGMLTVGLLGLLLGVIRSRSNTTTAILVHVAYDIVAALTSG
jgi:hypothetical protein